MKIKVTLNKKIEGEWYKSVKVFYDYESAVKFMDEVPNGTWKMYQVVIDKTDEASSLN